MQVGGWENTSLRYTRNGIFLLAGGGPQFALSLSFRQMKAAWKEISEKQA